MTRYALPVIGVVGAFAIARAFVAAAAGTEALVAWILASAVFALGLVTMGRQARTLDRLSAELGTLGEDASRSEARRSEAEESDSIALRPHLDAHLAGREAELHTGLGWLAYPAAVVTLGLVGAALAASAPAAALLLGATSLALGAALGGAAAIVTRAERRFAASMAHHIRGRLDAETPDGKRARSLDALVDRTSTLPDVARTLLVATERLEELRGVYEQGQATHSREQRELVETQRAMADTQRAMAETQREAVQEQRALAEAMSASLERTATAVRRELVQAGEMTARAAATAVTPAVERTVAIAAEHLSTVREAIDADAGRRREVERLWLTSLNEKAGQLFVRLDRDREAREQTDRARLERLELGWAGLLEGVAERGADVLGRLDERASSLVVGLGEEAAARRDADARLVAQMEKVLEQTAERDRARADVLAGAAALMRDELSGGLSALHTDVLASIDSQQQALASLLLETGERDRARATELASAATAIRSELAEGLGSMQVDLLATLGDVRDRIAEGADTEAQNRQRLETLATRLEGTQHSLGTAAREQADVLAAAVEASQGRMLAAEQQLSSRAGELFATFEGALEAQAHRLTQLEDGLADRHRAGAQLLADRLTDHAREIAQHADTNAGAIAQAIELVQAGGAELTAVAEMFAEAVDRQRAAADEWIAQLGRIDEAVMRAGEEAAADALGQYLARTHELFDQQLELQEELLERLIAPNRDDDTQLAAEHEVDDEVDHETEEPVPSVARVAAHA
jgi:hypothetical protein